MQETMRLSEKSPALSLEIAMGVTGNKNLHQRNVKAMEERDRI
jgi:hypothetical protein